MPSFLHSETCWSSSFYHAFQVMENVSTLHPGKFLDLNKLHYHITPFMYCGSKIQSLVGNTNFFDAFSRKKPFSGLRSVRSSAAPMLERYRILIWQNLAGLLLLLYLGRYYDWLMWFSTNLLIFSGKEKKH